MSLMGMGRITWGLFTTILCTTGTAIAQDMPTLLLDTAHGPPIPTSFYLWGIVAVGLSWLAVLWVVGAVGGGHRRRMYLTTRQHAHED